MLESKRTIQDPKSIANLVGSQERVIQKKIQYNFTERQSAHPPLQCRFRENSNRSPYSIYKQIVLKTEELQVYQNGLHQDLEESTPFLNLLMVSGRGLQKLTDSERIFLKIKIQIMIILDLLHKCGALCLFNGTADVAIHVMSGRKFLFVCFKRREKNKS